MPIVELSVDARVDGQQMRGFPLSLVYNVDEVQEFDYQEANDGDLTTFSALPVGQVDTVQVFLLNNVDQDVGIRVEGSESGSTAIRQTSGGLILIANASLTNSDLTVNNNSGSAARIRGLGAGT